MSGAPLRRALDRLTDAMSAAGTLLVVGIMVLMDADILRRALANAPIPGVPEIVTMSLAAIVFLQFAATLRAGRMIRSDGLEHWLGRRSARAAHGLQVAFCLLGAAVFVLMAWGVGPILLKAWRSSDAYGSVGVFTFPKWPVLAVVCFGTVVMALQYLVLAAGHVRAALRDEPCVGADPAARILS